MLRPLRLGSQILRSSRIVSSPINRQSLTVRPCTPFALKPSTTQRSFSLATARFQEATAPAEENRAESDAPTELTKFQELAEHRLIHPRIIDTIVNQMNIHTMTDVQRLTLNHCLDGSDVIGQARTGTGKTLAFLMPIVQRALKQDARLEKVGRENAHIDIKALIISPTRELAEQIAVEARKIVAGTNLMVQTAVGGTQKSRHLRQMHEQGCHILVGTPGRVKDILTDRSAGVTLKNIDTFVLDEADRLLDIGFAPDIEEIESCMPDRQQRPRQTLMFSATVPKSVVALVRRMLKPDFKFIRTVDPNESPTHERIPQKVVTVAGMQNQMPAILEIASKAMEAHRQDPQNTMPFKAIVYYGSVAEVTLAYNIVANMRAPGDSYGHPLAPLKIFQMSSKLEQAARTRESQGFRRCESGILFSSDVTARGMDFPDVSHVIQVGPPKAADDYVHRIGRTGRAGKSGEGWLIVNEDERGEVANRFKNTGITLQPERLSTAELDMSRSAQVPAGIAKILQLVESGVKATPFHTKKDTFRALFGVMSQQHPSRSKQTQIDMMNDLAKYGWGLATPPGVSSTLVAKMGFSNCRGINLEESSDRYSDDRGRGGRPGSGSRGGYNSNDPFGLGARGGVGVFSGQGGSGREQNNGFGGRDERPRYGREQNNRYGDRNSGPPRSREQNDRFGGRDQGSRRPSFDRGSSRGSGQDGSSW